MERTDCPAPGIIDIDRKAAQVQKGLVDRIDFNMRCDGREQRCDAFADISIELKVGRKLGNMLERKYIPGYWNAGAPIGIF